MKGHSDQLINGADNLASSEGFLAKNIKYESMEANYPCQFFCNWVWSVNNSKFLNPREAKRKAQNNGIRRGIGKKVHLTSHRHKLFFSTFRKM